MMKTRLLLILTFVTIFLYACNTGQEKKTGCLPPPLDFSEADLVGTWYNNEKLGDTDTLIIREDGKYKQILHLESRAFDYESDWQTWRIEYAESGIPSLHLEGLRVCAYFREMDCDVVGGGEGIWYDFCQEKWFPMSGEGTLMVLGVGEDFKQPPRGIELVLLSKYIESTWRYELEETAVPTVPDISPLAQREREIKEELVYVFIEGIIVLAGVGVVLLAHRRRQ